jgi:hypothetical protein
MRCVSNRPAQQVYTGAATGEVLTEVEFATFSEP